MWSFFFFFFFFFFVCDLFCSLFSWCHEDMYWSTRFHLVVWIKASFWGSKKKSPNLGSFLPTKTKKIWQKYLSDPHAFLSSLLHINHPILSKLSGLLRRFCDHFDRIVEHWPRACSAVYLFFLSLPQRKRDAPIDALQNRCAGTRGGGFCECESESTFVFVRFGKRGDDDDRRRRAKTAENDG